ncbi:MAG: right-handed parallel beta-helix repeat-containing protein, partial [Planctomycetota bacterium]
AGVNPNDADTQVTTRGKFARFYPKDNLVFRGITIERFGHNILSGPRWRQTGCVLQFGVPGVKPFFHMHDVLVEDVTLRWNSGGGASFHSTQGLTVRELDSLHNGGGGNVLGTVQNMLWEDVTTNFNNWRGALGHKRGWAIGGTKFHVFRDAIIRRHTALGNEMIGIWMDVNCENFLVEDAISIDNTSGIFLEISKGPMEVRGGLFADNNRSAIKLLCAEHVTLRDNLFVMSDGQQRSGTGYDENIGRNTQKAAAAVEYLFYNRSSVKSTAQWDVFGTELFGKPKTHTVYALPGPVLAEGNVIVAGEQRFVMSMSAWLPPERRSPETIGGAWTGAGNVYFGADENSFLFTDIEVPGESPDHKKQLGLSSWSQRFEESESTFVDPQFADAGNFDFTVSSDSPLAERADELPLIRLDPETVAEIRAWQQFLADLRPHEPAP